MKQGSPRGGRAAQREGRMGNHLKPSSTTHGDFACAPQGGERSMGIFSFDAKDAVLQDAFLISAFRMKNPSLKSQVTCRR